MPCMSTEDAVNELRCLVETTESESYTMAVLLDFSGAIDNIWRPLVLNALKDRNRPNNIYKVRTSYFADRTVSLA